MAIEPVRIPIRDIVKEVSTVGPDNFILVDDGTGMAKAKASNAIDKRAKDVALQEIDDLNLGSAAQSDVGDFATSAQGALAESAVQPGDLAPVATSGDYGDLNNLPTLGTAAATDVSDYATSEQGLLANSSLQPEDVGSFVQAHSAFLDSLAGMTPGSAGQVIAFDGSGDPIAINAGAGDLIAANNLSDVDDPVLAAGNLGLIKFKTVPLLLADTLMSYAADPGKIQVGPGDVIEADGFRYEVAASDATDAHVETVGGVKLIYRPAGKWRFEAFGADGTGQTPTGDKVLAAVQAAARTGNRVVFDAAGGVFDLSGTEIKDVTDGAMICIEFGKFKRDDDGALTTALFKFAQYAEVAFLFSTFDMGYAGSTNIEEYIDGAQCVACFGCDLVRVEGCWGGNTRGDFIYTSRDTAGNGGGTNRNTGQVFVANNYMHNCKRNYVAITDAIYYSVTGNTCTSDGDDGAGNDYVWARSAVLNFEPNSTLDALGYGVCNGNTLRVKGAKNPIRWAVANGKIPNIYKSVICNDNVMDCTGVERLITIEARGKLEIIGLSENVSTLTSAAEAQGIIVTGFNGDAEIVGGAVYCKTGATEAVYFNTGADAGALSRQASICVTGGKYKMLNSGASFRGVRIAGVGPGGTARVASVDVNAVDSTNQAVYILGRATDEHMAAGTIIGCTGSGFVVGPQVQWAAKATIVGNSLGLVQSQSNDSVQAGNNH